MGQCTTDFEYTDKYPDRRAWCIAEREKDSHRGSPFGIQNYLCFIWCFIEYIIVKDVMENQENLDFQNQYVVT